ncbi:MAG: hypothetical protein AAGA91_11445 [Pseudomonadota bacterium]
MQTLSIALFGFLAMLVRIPLPIYPARESGYRELAVYLIIEYGEPSTQSSHDKVNSQNTDA